MIKSKRLLLIGILSGLILLSILVLQFVWFFKAADLAVKYNQKRKNLALNALSSHLNDTVKNKAELKKQIFDLFLALDIDTPEVTEFIPIGADLKGFKNKKEYLFVDLKHSKYSKVALFFKSKSKIVQLNTNQWLIFSSLFSLIVIASVIAFIYLFLKQRRINEMKTDFLNMITHEFKTPIATMSLISEVLDHSSSQNHPQKIKRYAGILQSEISRLKMLIDKSLQVASFDNKENKVEFSNTNLLRLLNESIDYIKAEYEKEDLTIELYSNLSDDSIYADEAHIRNIFLNILDNACKYSDKHKEIKINVSFENDEYYIKIKDNGIGIAKKNLSHIFDKFYRISTGDRHDVKGSGLGLFYAKRMIELHKGNITVESTLNKGSIFKIRIPKTSKKESLKNKAKSLIF